MHLGATRGQRSDEFSLLTKGNQQESTRAGDGAQSWKIIPLRADIRNLERVMIVPMGIPSRNNGVASMVRCPARF